MSIYEQFDKQLKTTQKRLQTLCERLNSNEIKEGIFLKKICFNLRK